MQRIGRQQYHRRHRRGHGGPPPSATSLRGIAVVRRAVIRHHRAVPWVVFLRDNERGQCGIMRQRLGLGPVRRTTLGQPADTHHGQIAPIERRRIARLEHRQRVIAPGPLLRVADQAQRVLGVGPRPAIGRRRQCPRARRRQFAQRRQLAFAIARQIAQRRHHRRRHSIKLQPIHHHLDAATDDPAAFCLLLPLLRPDRLRTATVRRRLA